MGDRVIMVSFDICNGDICVGDIFKIDICIIISVFEISVKVIFG